MVLLVYIPLRDYHLAGRSSWNRAIYAESKPDEPLCTPQGRCAVGEYRLCTSFIPIVQFQG